MSGILAVIGKRDPKDIKALASRMSHRGPDGLSLFVTPKGSVLCQVRIPQTEGSTEKQPDTDQGSVYQIFDGTIYNHYQLINEHLREHQFQSSCDKEIMGCLYRKYGTGFCHLPDGIFAFVLVDGDKWMVARDPIGVKPLYYGKDKKGNLYVASELKAIVDQVMDIQAFPPGHYMSHDQGMVKYYHPEWQNPDQAYINTNLDLLREKLIRATQKQLTVDVPLGVFLSGGLDSGIIASIASRFLKASGHELHTFSIGINSKAPDIEAARVVAKFIGSTHHEVYFSIHEGIQALRDVVYHLETYDVNTIRSAIPMYLLSKAVAQKGIRVILSGDGADEIFGGYLYFYKAPTPTEFQKETIVRVLRLSAAGCLRADKSARAHGIEIRIPFLDKAFLASVIPFKPEDKIPSRTMGKPEKLVLRKAFEAIENPYLPENILWRQKEQLNDGVGYAWIDGLRQYGEQMISDAEMAAASDLYPHNTPDTKEAMLYRKIFHSHFPQDTAARTVLKWVPKWQINKDPSGRVCENHFEKLTDVAVMT
jgi:asparagine synthase (glutamine-hydrolysing)